MSATCSHVDTIEVTELPDRIDGCEECLKTGSRWVHLRMCTSCGKIGCCDSSPNRHATRHANASGHPIIRSAQAGRGLELVLHRPSDANPGDGAREAS